MLTLLRKLAKFLYYNLNSALPPSASASLLVKEQSYSQYVKRTPRRKRSHRYRFPYLPTNSLKGVSPTQKQRYLRAKAEAKSCPQEAVSATNDSVYDNFISSPSDDNMASFKTFITIKPVDLRKAYLWFRVVQNIILVEGRADYVLDYACTPFSLVSMVFHGWLSLNEALAWEESRFKLGEGLVELYKTRIWYKVLNYNKSAPRPAQPTEVIFQKPWPLYPADYYNWKKDKKERRRNGPFGPALLQYATSEELEGVLEDLIRPIVKSDSFARPKRFKNCTLFDPLFLRDRRCEESENNQERSEQVPVDDEKPHTSTASTGGCMKEEPMEEPIYLGNSDAQVSHSHVVRRNEGKNWAVGHQGVGKTESIEMIVVDEQAYTDDTYDARISVDQAGEAPSIAMDAGSPLSSIRVDGNQYHNEPSMQLDDMNPAGMSELVDAGRIIAQGSIPNMKVDGNSFLTGPSVVTPALPDVQRVQAPPSIDTGEGSSSGQLARQTFDKNPSSFFRQDTGLENVSSNMNLVDRITALHPRNAKANSSALSGLSVAVPVSPIGQRTQASTVNDTEEGSSTGQISGQNHYPGRETKGLPKRSQAKDCIYDPFEHVWTPKLIPPSKAGSHQ